MEDGWGRGSFLLPHSNPSKNKNPGATSKIFKKKCKGVPIKYKITSPKIHKYGIINLGGNYEPKKLTKRPPIFHNSHI